MKVRRHIQAIAILLVAAAVLLPSACQRDLATYYPEWEKSRWQRLDLFRNIETLVIAPLEAGERIGKDERGYMDMVEKAVFDQVMRRQRFRLLEPADFGNALKKVQAAPAAGDAALPTGEKELISAAAAAGADAVLCVRIDHINPYFPPKIVLRARVYAARQASISDRTIIDMTDDGVPQEVPRSLREKFLWQRDLVLDAHEESTMALVRAFARRHEVNLHGFGPEIFVRSMERYATFCAAVLAGQLFEDAEFYKHIDRYREALKAHGKTGDKRLPAAAP